MRIAVLCSSPYSETGCAVAARLAEKGFTPVGALTLPAWDRTTLIRKVGQWGFRDSFRFAISKLTPTQLTTDGPVARKLVRNPYLQESLQEALRNKGGTFRNLREVAAHYRFPVVSVANLNSARALARLRQWSPDLAIFTGGNILRDEFLKIPRFGVINAHLALLPEIRGMSSPEWSLLCDVPLGTTIHFMDSGIDTGPILIRREFAAGQDCLSLTDLRNRMIAGGIDLIVEAVSGLANGTMSAIPQADCEAGREAGPEKDNQFFVMHDRLKSIAAHRLKEITNPSSSLQQSMGGRDG